MSVLEAAAEPAPIPILVPERSFGNDLRAIKIVWQRDIIRFWGEKPRILASLGQPILYWLVLGTGISSMLPGHGAVSMRTFLFPGVLSLSVLFTCFLSAGSLVLDREFGFMRVMLVAPVRRSAIALGKCLGGTTIGVAQGSMLLAIGLLVDVPFDPALIATLLAELALLSFALTACGVLVAVRITRMQSFLAITQLSLTPLYFLSGALFPIAGLPPWLSLLTRVNPLSYAVDPMRRAVFERLGVPVATVTWGGAPVPVLAELGVLAALSLLALSLATVQFRKAD
jgi:ABC-2 type transport system permease protein